MTKPNDFRETYILGMDVAYQNTNTSTKGTHSGEGVLHRGRVVWLQGSVEGVDEETEVTAYAEGVGIVALSSGCLDRAR